MNKNLIELNHMTELIKQPYAITMARHKLNTHEIRIMMRILEALQGDVKYAEHPHELKKIIKENKIITIPTKLLLPEGSKHYEDARAALKGLTKKSVTITSSDEKGKKSEIYTNIITVGEYEFRTEEVTIEISKKLLPEFLALAKNYSKYLLDVAFNSSSPNVMKLYQYISHWQDKKQILLKVSSLREWLKIEDTYDRPYHIKRYILEPAAKELRKTADVWFEVAESVKDGRRMVGWKLNIYKKKDAEQSLPTGPTEKNLEELPHDKLQILQKRLVHDFALGLRQAKKVIALVENGTIGILKINKVLYEIHLQKLDAKPKPIANLGAFTVTRLTTQFDIVL